MGKLLKGSLWLSFFGVLAAGGTIEAAEEQTE